MVFMTISYFLLDAVRSLLVYVVGSVICVLVGAVAAPLVVLYVTWAVLTNVCTL